MSKFFSLPAVVAAFERAKDELQGDWSSSSDVQKKFIDELYPIGLTALSQVQAGELETSFRLVGETGFEVGSVLTTCAKWQFPGESHSWPRCTMGFRGEKIFASGARWNDIGPDQPTYKMVKMKRFKVRRVPDCSHPVFVLQTSNTTLDEEVCLTPLSEVPSQPFGLWTMANKLSATATSEGAERFNALYFPMINVDEKEEVNWPLGMSCGAYPVVGAQQGCVLKVNQEGFFERTNFAISLFAASGDGPQPRAYFFDGPFLYWRIRKGEVNFVAWIDKDNFGDPGVIDFANPSGNSPER